MLAEVTSAKYFALIVDATPDSSHKEQTSIILCYISIDTQKREYEIKETFVKYVEFSKKKGKQIAEMILDTLEENDISFQDCRGQGYDNRSNMSGRYKGVQARLLQKNSLAMYPEIYFSP